jgi:uncharacterized protein
MSGQIITVNALDVDGTLRRSWKCEFLGTEGRRIDLLGVFDRTVEHEHLGTIAKGTISYEHFWLDRWFNVFRFHRPDGQFFGYYCNICKPPQMLDGELTYVDLEVDVVAGPNGKTHILDTEEFEQRIASGAIDSRTREIVDATTDELATLIKAREFPFDHCL